MPCNERLVERIRAALKRRRGTAERRMFGGVCFTLNGNMVCGVAGNDLMVRVGKDQYEDALKRPNVREMDFTGRPLKGFVFVGAPAIRSDSSLKHWVETGIAYVDTLPAKARTNKRS